MKSHFYRIAILAVSALILTQCNKRTQLRQEIVVKSQQVEELRQQQKQLQAALEGTGNLGGYNVTTESHLVQLKAEVQRATAEVNDFKSKKQELTQEIDSILKEMDAHRVKYR